MAKATKIYHQLRRDGRTQGLERYNRKRIKDWVITQKDISVLLLWDENSFKTKIGDFGGKSATFHTFLMKMGLILTKLSIVSRPIRDFSRIRDKISSLYTVGKRSHSL